jgi:hypothetical protein
LVEKGAVNLLSDGTSLPSDAFFFFSRDNNLRAHVRTVGKIGGGVKFTKLEQHIDGLDVSADCGKSRVVIEHELFHKTCDDPLVSRLAAAWI